MKPTLPSIVYCTRFLDSKQHILLTVCDDTLLNITGRRFTEPYKAPELFMNTYIHRRRSSVLLYRYTPTVLFHPWNVECVCVCVFNILRVST